MNPIIEVLKTKDFKKLIDLAENEIILKIKDLRHKAKEGDFFTLQKAAINRKQVPLCSSHHIALHNNLGWYCR